MAYDFTALSPADFEDLVRDLVGCNLGVRFEAFAAGPDGGIDGRHSTAGHAVILQAKHYAGSSYAALKSVMMRERASIDRLSPDRYILTTSRPLSPKNKQELATIIGPALRSEADILGRGDLNALLRKFPEVEKANIKLWLSSAAVLERIVRAAAYAFNNLTRAEIEAKVRVYAPNPSFEGARNTLEANHVVIISGPPGVGKTTLAEMLSYAYFADGWELVAIRSLDDGLSEIKDRRKQIFFFDDFLGRISLDRRALSHKDSDLARFIKRVRASPNGRFILTTRAYIFEEARRVSEHLADQRLDITRYLLDVGIYTRRIKARILYNHLLIAQTPQTHVNALIRSGELGNIIDHKNYNPRIIEWMTDIVHMAEISADDYPVKFLDALTHPSRLWDSAFRTHISTMCRHLLIGLFFCSEYGGESIEDLRLVYQRLHPHLCAIYGEPHDPKDFEEALRILEGGFVTIVGTTVTFVNPSLRDYLTEYLNDLRLLREMAAGTSRSEWARQLWRYANARELSGEDLASLALCFVGVANEFTQMPVWSIRREENYSVQSPTGLSNTARIDLLLEWWRATDDNRFIDVALQIARSPVSGMLDPWRDGTEVIDLIRRLRDDEYFGEQSWSSELADNLENATVEMLNNGVDSDDLEKISDAIEEWKDSLGTATLEAIDDCIRAEIQNVRDAVSDMDSESTLEGHMEMLEKLSKRTTVTAIQLGSALETVRDRIVEVRDQAVTSEAPSIRAASPNDADIFDDTALANLFAPLLRIAQ